MLVTEFGMLMLSKKLQPEKTLSLMLFTDSGTSACVRAVQPRKQAVQIVLTEFGILMVSRASQSAKASFSILVTDAGTSNDFKALQLQNAPRFDDSNGVGNPDALQGMAICEDFVFNLG